MTGDIKGRKCSALAGKGADRRPCARWAITGGTVCGAHGGKAPQVRARANMLSEQEMAQAAVRRFGWEPSANPFADMKSIVGEMIAVKDWLRAKVERLETIEGYTEKGEEQLRAVVSAYLNMLDRTASQIGNLIKLNIEDRLATIEEDQARAILRAFEAAMVQMGIVGPAQQEPKRVFAAQLKLVS